MLNSIRIFDFNHFACRVRGICRVWSSATVTALYCLLHVKEVSVGYDHQPQLLHNLVCFMSKVWSKVWVWP